MVEVELNEQEISIHALREEGDDDFADADETPEIFLSTPSARRATYAPRTFRR